MIFPDINIQDFTKKHPRLEKALKDFKELKKINYDKAKPYYTKDVIGAMLESDSGKPKKHIFIKRHMGKNPCGSTGK